MKQIVSALGVVALLASCNNTKTETAETKEVQHVDTTKQLGVAYKIDTTSNLVWTGTKPTGQHSGIFKLSGGNLIVDNGALTGGSATIDVTSLDNTDLAADPENKAKLEGHLKSPDFFDIVKFPTAKFIITSVEPYKADSTSTVKNATHTISGNLTLKDSTKNVSFPAKIVIDSTGVMATADFNIDRTLWGMNYKGPNNPQDWMISKTVNIKLNLSAKK